MRNTHGKYVSSSQFSRTSATRKYNPPISTEQYEPCPYLSDCYLEEGHCTRKDARHCPIANTKQLETKCQNG